MKSLTVNMTTHVSILHTEQIEAFLEQHVHNFVNEVIASDKYSESYKKMLRRDGYWRRFMPVLWGNRYYMPLWEFAQTFGPHFHSGNEFMSNICIVIDSDMQEVAKLVHEADRLVPNSNLDHTFEDVCQRVTRLLTQMKTV